MDLSVRQDQGTGHAGAWGLCQQVTKGRHDARTSVVFPVTNAHDAGIHAQLGDPIKRVLKGGFGLRATVAQPLARAFVHCDQHDVGKGAAVLGLERRVGQC